MGHCLSLGYNRDSAIFGVYKDDADTLMDIYEAMDDELIRNQPLMNVVEEMVYHCAKLFPKYFLEFDYCTEIYRWRKHHRRPNGGDRTKSLSRAEPHKTATTDAPSSHILTSVETFDDENFIQVKIQGATLGVLKLRKSKTDPTLVHLSTHQKHLIESIIYFTAKLVERNHMEDQATAVLSILSIHRLAGTTGDLTTAFRAISRIIRESVGCEWSSVLMIDHTTKTMTQLYAETINDNDKNNDHDTNTSIKNVKPKHVKIKGFDKGVLGYIAQTGKIVRNNTPSKSSKIQLQFEPEVEIYDSSHANNFALNEYTHAISQASDKLSNASVPSQNMHKNDIIPSTDGHDSHSFSHRRRSSYLITVIQTNIQHKHKHKNNHNHNQNENDKTDMTKNKNKHSNNKNQQTDDDSDNNSTKVTQDHSIDRNGMTLKGFLCVPILNDTLEVIGVIATANKIVQTPFTHLDIEMLQTLAIEIAQILQRFATKILLSSIDQQDSFVSMLDMYQPQYKTNTHTNELETNLDYSNNAENMRNSAPTSSMNIDKIENPKRRLMARSGSIVMNLKDLSLSGIKVKHASIDGTVFSPKTQTDVNMVAENESDLVSSSDNGQVPNSLQDIDDNIESEFKSDFVIQTDDEKPLQILPTHKKSMSTLPQSQSSGLLDVAPIAHRCASYNRRSSVDYARKSGVADDYHLFVVSRTTPLQQIVSLNFDAFSHSPEELQQLIMEAFVNLDFLPKLSVNTTKLQNFVVDISKNYRENPYHNFRHAFSVFSFSFSFLKQTQVHTKLDPIDSLAMLVAALAHDVDHPGNTNDWEINSQSELALKHNDVSVLENHHCNIAFQLLRKSENNFISQFNFDQRKLFRKRVIEAILSTDMTHHFELCQSLDQSDPSAFDIGSINKLDGKLIQKLLNIVTHSGDLSAQCMPYPLAMKWARLVCDEFTNQVKKETLKKLPIKSIMQGLEDEETFLKSQCGFFDFILKPLWRSFSRFFPQCAHFYLTLLHNRQQLQLQLESLVKEKQKQKNQILKSMDDTTRKSDTIQWQKLKASLKKSNKTLSGNSPKEVMTNVVNIWQRKEPNVKTLTLQKTSTE